MTTKLSETLTLLVRLLVADRGGIMGLNSPPGPGLTLAQAAELAWGAIASGPDFGDIGASMLHQHVWDYLDAACAHPEGDILAVAVHAEHPDGQKRRAWHGLRGDEATACAARACWASECDDEAMVRTARAQWHRPRPQSATSTKYVRVTPEHILAHGTA